MTSKAGNNLFRQFPTTDSAALLFGEQAQPKRRTPTCHNLPQCSPTPFVDHRPQTKPIPRFLRRSTYGYSHKQLRQAIPEKQRFVVSMYDSRKPPACAKEARLKTPATWKGVPTIKTRECLFPRPNCRKKSIPCAAKGRKRRRTTQPVPTTGTRRRAHHRHGCGNPTKVRLNAPASKQHVVSQCSPGVVRCQKRRVRNLGSLTAPAPIELFSCTGRTRHRRIIILAPFRSA